MDGRQGWNAEAIQTTDTRGGRSMESQRPGLAPIKAIKCGCGYTGQPTVILRETGNHYADRRCPSCNTHHGYEKKPDSDPTKYRRQNAHRDLATKYGRGFCEMCLAKESNLPKGVTLEGHHVIEYKDGGDSEKGNIWVICTACHKLIHWRRTYLNEVTKVAEALVSWKN